MHHVSALLLLAAGVCAAEPAIAIRPKEITQATSLAFNDDGSPRRAKREFRFKLKLVPPEGMRLARVTAVEVGEVQIDGGEKLPTKVTGGPEQFNEWEQDRADYDIDFTLSGAATTARQVVRMSGTVTLMTLTGAARQADLMPIKEHLGAPVRLDGLDDPLTIERKGVGLTLRGSPELFDRLQKVVLLDAKGEGIETRGWSGGSTGEEHYRTYSATVPDAGGVRLTIAGPSSEVRVPFVFEKLSLEPAAKSAAPAKVVKTTEVKPAKPKKEGAVPAEEPEPGAAKGF